MDFRVDHSPRKEMDHLLGSWAIIVADLQSVQSTIQSLTLGISDNPAYFDPPCLRRFEPIGTLRAFTSLRKLRLPYHALVHRDYGKATYQKPEMGTLFPLSLASGP